MFLESSASKAVIYGANVAWSYGYRPFIVTAVSQRGGQLHMDFEHLHYATLVNSEQVLQSSISLGKF